MDFLADTRRTKESSQLYADFLGKRLEELASVGVSLRSKMSESGSRPICIGLDGVEGRRERIIKISPAGKLPIEFDFHPQEQQNTLPRLVSVNQEIGEKVVCEVMTLDGGEEVTYTYEVHQRRLREKDFKKRDIRWFGCHHYFREYFERD